MRVRQLMAHTKMWPYPSTSANLLKLFTDLQVFLVTLTSLILKIDPESDSISRGFGWTGSLYGDLMWVLLLITAVPTVFALVYKTPVEKAQKFLHKAARVDLDDEGSTVAQRRLTLRRRVQDSVPRLRATSRAGDGTVHADTGRREETLNPLAHSTVDVRTEAASLSMADRLFEAVTGSRDLDQTMQFSEFEQWWHRHNGNAERLKNIRTGFQNIEMRDGIAEIGRAEFTQVVIESGQGDWVERVSARYAGRKFYINKLTRRSQWTDVGVEYLEEFLQLSGIQWPPTQGQAIHSRDAGRHEETQNPLARSRSRRGGAAPTVAQARPSAANPWVERFSEQHNRAYWINTQTRQSTWTNPSQGLHAGPVIALPQESSEDEWVEETEV